MRGTSRVGGKRGTGNPPPEQLPSTSRRRLGEAEASIDDRQHLIDLAMRPQPPPPRPETITAEEIRIDYGISIDDQWGAGRRAHPAKTAVAAAPFDQDAYNEEAEIAQAEEEQDVVYYERRCTNCVQKAVPDNPCNKEGPDCKPRQDEKHDCSYKRRTNRK